MKRARRASLNQIYTKFTLNFDLNREKEYEKKRMVN